jgi:hypothetical protein
MAGVNSADETLVAILTSCVAWFGPTTSWWVVTVRPDIAASALEVLALYVVMRDWDRLRIRSVAVAGVVFFAAWCFKQSALSLFLGTCVLIALHRRWTALLILAGTCGLSIALVLSTGSENYRENVLAAPALAPWKWTTGVGNAASIFLSWGFLLILALSHLWIRKVQVPPGRELFVPIHCFSVILAVALALSTIAGSRVGSSRNYYFSSWVAGMILVTFVEFRWLRAFREAAVSKSAADLRAGLQAALLCACIAYASLICICSPAIARPTATFVGVPQLQDDNVTFPCREISFEVVALIGKDDKPLFCDDGTMVRLALGREGPAVPVLDPTIYWDAWSSGRVRDGGIFARFQEHYFAVVWVLKGSPWENEAVSYGYLMAGSFEGWNRYVPPVQPSSR